MGNQNNKLKRSNTKNIRDKKDSKTNKNMMLKKSISSVINFNSNIFIQKFENDPFDEYSKEKLIGKGAFGEVYLVRHNITGTIRAMKVIDKNNEEEQLTDEEILNEINILKKIDHPNIVKIFEFYSNKSTYYLILEFCEGGNLYEFVDENKLSEFQVIYIMFQILSAMNYCHNMNILHRDLKPDNILIKKNEYGLFRVKICDFGTSYIFKGNRTKSYTYV